MNHITIRAAEHTEEECLQLRALYLAARQQTFTWLDTTSYHLSDFDRDTQEEYILLAVYEETIIGFISIWLADNFIHHLYVGRKFHNQGAGSLLLKEAADTTGFPIRLKCLQKNVSALAFYTKNGFVIAGKGNTEEGEYLLMELSRQPASWKEKPR